MSSKAQLEHAGRGMNFECVDSHEYEDQGVDYRIEVFRARFGHDAMAYVRVGAYWKQHWSQRTAMEKRRLLDMVINREKAAKEPEEPFDFQSDDCHGSARYDGKERGD
jgi:hypothetical protein